MSAVTQTIAPEVGRSGVTANAVCAGSTRTRLLEGIAETGGGRLIDSLTRAVPVRRLGEPEDVAAGGDLPWPPSAPATSPVRRCR